MWKGGKTPRGEKEREKRGQAEEEEEGRITGCRMRAVGWVAEICTNLRLLVMSGDKLHQQKESGRRTGGRGQRDGRRWARATRGRGENAIISIADIAISACVKGIRYVACLGDFSRTPCIFSGKMCRLHFPPDWRLGRKRQNTLM